MTTIGKSKIPDDWEKLTWGDLATLEYGKGLLGYKYSTGRVPVYGTNGQIGWHDKPLYDNCGIIVGRKGAYRGIHFSPFPFFVIDTAFYLKPKKPINIKWAYWKLKTYDINSMDSGSAIPSTSRDEFYSLPVSVPPLSEQKAIANALNSFDNKIKLLKNQNKTLETIAQTIFKEWFVKFNFPDNDGKPYKDSGGKMIDSELGSIPMGWKTGKLSEVVQIHDSKRVPLSNREREMRQGHYPYYGATTIMDYVNDYLFDGIFLLLAEDGSVMDENGYPVLQYVWGKIWVNNHAHILQGDNNFSTEMLYLFFRQRKISEIVTGAVQLKINQRNLLGIDIVIPEISQLKRFNETIKDFFNKIRNNHEQIKTLTKLRDTLLPKLMSGQLRV